jgi:DNA-binding XRE family transcriptional regulator
MPAIKTKTPKKPKRSRRSRTAVARQAARLRATAASYVLHDDRPTHVILPIEEYDRLMDALEAQELAEQLDDPKTEWVEAEDAALEIAGSWLAKVRKQAGLTQKQLAAKLRVPQSQISRIEKHPERSTMRTMKRIAAALGVDVATLLSFASRHE